MFYLPIVTSLMLRSRRYDNIQELVGTWAGVGIGRKIFCEI